MPTMADDRRVVYSLIVGLCGRCEAPLAFCVCVINRPMSFRGEDLSVLLFRVVELRDVCLCREWDLMRSNWGARIKGAVLCN